MSLFTEYRGYPYPRDGKEAARGGPHSEALARAVAADLDTLDAGWTAEMQHTTLMQTKSGDATGLSASTTYTLTAFAVEKAVGTGISGSILQVLPGGEGWYHVVATLRSKASAAVTAGAQHRLIFSRYTSIPGSGLTLQEVRYSVTYQAGTTDMYNGLEGMFYMGTSDELRFQFFHTNVASSATVVGSGTGGTRISVTKILGG